MTRTKPELVRCVCGRKAVVWKYSASEWIVKCGDDDCWRGLFRKTERGAVAAWNRVMGGKR
jgi:hypothetical protein